MLRPSMLLLLVLTLVTTAAGADAVVAPEGSAKKTATADWAGNIKLPAGETAVRLFNGKDLAGWRKRPDEYFTVDGAAIRAANGDARIPLSTYLFTEKEYRDFRLLLEIKQTVGKAYSPMHSGIALLGSIVPNNEADPFGFRGPLALFCNEWGVWGADGRGVVFPPTEPKRTIRNLPHEKVGDWNRVETLVLGNRLRVVANGKLVVDYTEEDPKRMRPSPIGLQLHSNSRPQEYRFRGLLLVENPQDELVTANE